MTHGERFDFDIRLANLHGADWIILSMTDKACGGVYGCRWHVDAQPREVATALRALADKIDKIGFS